MTVFGQNPRGNRRLGGFAGRTRSDTAVSKPQVPDTLKLPPPDSISVSDIPPFDSLAMRRDSIRRAREDSLDLLEKSSLTKPAFSAAKDSSKQVFADGQRKMFYWGDVEVTYENIKLKADYMEYDMNTGTVFARGTYDTLTGEWKGRP